MKTDTNQTTDPVETAEGATSARRSRPRTQPAGPTPAASPTPSFDMRATLAALDRLSTPELAARYAELHGKPPRIRHKRYLVKRCAWKLQERALGGLSQAALARLDELIAEIRIPDAPPKRIAVARLSKREAGAARPSPAPTPPRRPDLPRPGTVIAREWRGRMLRLTVLDDNGGFELDGVVHASLSAAAKAVTGAHWNGKLFWGIANTRPNAASNSGADR